MTNRQNERFVHHHCPKKDMHKILIVKADRPDGTCPRCHKKVFDPDDHSSGIRTD